MKYLISIASAAALIFSAANATTISTRNYADYVSGGPSTGYVFEDDGVTMTMTAGLYTDDAAALIQEGQHNARPVLYNGYGTGVSHDNNDGQHTVDGYIPEVLILAFDTTVKLTNLVFSYINDYGKFDFFIDSNNDGMLDQRVLIDADLSGSFDNVTLSDLLSMDLLTGTTFGVGASYYEEECYYSSRKQRTVCKKKPSEWKLKYVKFEEVPDVPLPAAMPLFLAGLAGFGFAARKKKA